MSSVVPLRQRRTHPVLAGCESAETLYRAIQADPRAPLSVAIVGAGGSGKTALLAAVEDAYRAAGVPVVEPQAPGVTAVGPQASGVAVLVDDAQELTDADTDRLRQLVGTTGLRLVVAYRPWPRRPALDALAVTLGRSRPPVMLGHLDRSQVELRVAALLAGGPVASLPDAVIDLLHAPTGGLPLLVDRAVRAIVELGGSARSLPSELVEALRDDLARLDPTLRGLLLAVAVGAAVDLDVLGPAVGLDPTAVSDLLDQARATGLLRADGTLVPLTAAAVLAAAPADLVRATGLRVFDLHREHGWPVLDLVRELTAAGARTPRLAAALQDGGDTALTTSPALAAELYEQAVAAGTPAAALAARRAQAAALSGDLDTALRLADQVIADQTSPDVTIGVRVAACVLAHRGMLAQSAELYRWAAVGAVAGPAEPLSALALLGTGALDEARAALAGPPGGRPTLLAGAESLMASGVLESVVGSPVTALSALTRAATLLEPAGPVILPDTPTALAAIVALHCGELDVATSVLSRAVHSGSGGVLALPRHQLLLAWTAMLRGDTALAHTWLDRATPATGQLEPRDVLFATALEVGLARRDCNMPALLAAWAAAREAVVRHPVDLFSLLPLGELAVAAARLRDEGRVTPHLEEARVLLARLGDPVLWATPLHWYGLHAAVLANHPEAAEPHATALARAAATSRYAAVLATGARTWTQVLSGEFDPEAVESAARNLESVGLAWDGSRLAGQAAIRTTDRKAMSNLLGCARMLQVTAPGAPPVAEVPQRPTCTATAATARGEAAGGSALLSAREREVAQLVLTGMTYRQIGERLFISAKTVEHHVARMRQRLDVESRGELFSRLRTLVGDRDLPGVG